MWSFLERLLDSSTFSPHGICLLWEPELIWLHVVADACIAAAYFSIPFALAILVTKRRDLKFGWVYWAFAIFIMRRLSVSSERLIIQQECGSSWVPMAPRSALMPFMIAFEPIAAPAIRSE